MTDWSTYYKKDEIALSIKRELGVIEKIKLIVEKYKNIYGTFGIHPHETKKYTYIDSKFIYNIKRKYNKIVGIGETGLDFYYNHSDKKIQKMENELQQEKEKKSIWKKIMPVAQKDGPERENCPP